MTSSSHSALASLTATYTDSEDEDIEESDSRNVQRIERSSAANSPQGDSNSRDAQSIASSGGGESSNKSGGKTGTAGGGALGLVSYQDDLIDDDAVDDHYTSDSNTGVDTDQPSDILLLNDEDISAEEFLRKSENPSMEECSTEVVNLEGDESTSTSRKSSRIPPEPLGKCSGELIDKITKLYERKVKGGLDINSLIQKNKNFRNPSIYEKLIKYCDIDELGSNYPRDVFDPHEWHESSYFDELAKVQKAEMERREKERKDRTKVDFVLGTVKKPSVPTGLSQQGATEAETRRKSKWDQRGVMPPLMMNIAAQPAQQPTVGVVQPSFTTAASGTKSTVISAFGSIKKPKV